jgi:hypothetical protein
MLRGQIAEKYSHSQRSHLLIWEGCGGELRLEIDSDVVVVEGNHRDVVRHLQPEFVECPVRAERDAVIEANQAIRSDA